ncbi:hypothetical protein D0C36_07800 [Mucilaginibacter conchicola]|uniref:Uncharacterized protein n=1 Tax=Mucilaginibacter conchicola TaxID=2303333 RepID=A0A372NZ78_9SPHI|nr:hypothetical protein [Mucilaginibacter conchicola]RFZ95415.1 hypothetical protein D0C36_07800 [Mucilaginibacter conchicola]
MGAYKKWLVFSLIWAVFMFVCMGLLWPWYLGDAITVRSITGNIIAYTLGGLLYGYTMYRLAQRRLKKQQLQ